MATTQPVRSKNPFRQPDLQPSGSTGTVASPWQQSTTSSNDSALTDMQSLSQALPTTTTTTTTTTTPPPPPLPARPAEPDTSADAVIAATLARSLTPPPPQPLPPPPPRRTTEQPPLVPQQPFPPGYQPSHHWMPGQPLLKQGRLLLYPRGRGACYKCQNTGYKAGDATRACANRCWSVYGCVYPDQVLRVLARPEARAHLELQRPLPDWRNPAVAMRIYHTPILPLPMFAAPPPLALAQPVQQRQTTTRRRQSPPRVNRTQQAAEEGVDEDGEAPPAYEDVARAPSSARLDPQRTGTLRRTQATATSGAVGAATADMEMQGVQITTAPPNVAPLPGTYPRTTHHPIHPQGPHHYPQTGTTQVHLPGRAYPRPPPGAVVVQPGDPRIGGRLCYKCNGRGVRESFLFGDETCHYCNGLGRIM